MMEKNYHRKPENHEQYREIEWEMNIYYFSSYK